MKRLLKNTLVALAVLCIVATLLPLFRAEAWWVRLFDFPRIQIFLLGLLVLIGYGFVRERKAGTALMVLLTLSILYQGYRLFPYAPFAPEEVIRVEDAAPDSTLSLLVANVLMKNRDAQPFLDLVAQYNPDLVLAMEVDAWWTEQLAPLEATYPHHVLHPLPNTYGMSLYARHPLRAPEVSYLLTDSIPSIEARLVMPSGHRLWLHALHPEPPNPQYATNTKERDAEILLVAKKAFERGEPALVFGDFNDVPWSATTRLFHEVSTLLDPREGRGWYNTFHAKNVLMRWPLDHVFHSEDFALVRLERGPGFGSDHYPLYVELAIHPDAAWRQEPNRPEPEDLEAADGEIEEGRDGS